MFQSQTTMLVVLKSLLFLLSVSLIISLSTCHVKKREAPDGKLYVYISDRKGCESVQSQNPCAVSWKLHKIFAKVYKLLNKNVESENQRINGSNSLSNNCLRVIQNALCSQIAPKCSIEEDSHDYGDTSILCDDVYRSCSVEFVNRLKNEGFCKKLKTGKHPNSPACVAPTTPVTGVCPQPKFKVSTNIFSIQTSSCEVYTYQILRKQMYFLKTH